MNFARRATEIADALLGASLLRAQRRRRSGAIVLYHRVSPLLDPAYPPLHPREFEAHCQKLRRCFSILPLAEFIERRRAGKSLRGCCAITFDDGYRDFLEHAHPILQRLQLPATHFLVLQSVVDGRPNWNWRANRLIEAARQHPALPPHLRVLAEKTSVEMVDYMGAWRAEERSDWLQSAEEELGQMRPLDPEPAMMRAEDLARCDASLISWGSHTSTHATLRLCDAAALRQELRSRHELSRLAGSAIDFVSYPNGSHSPQVLEAAREAGYGAGLAVGQAEVSHSSPLMALPRFDIGWMPAPRLRLEIGGAVQALRGLRGGHGALSVRDSQ